MQVTWFGHASLRIKTNAGTVIYVDPFAGEESWYDSQADLVLVTHAHYDHLKVSLLHKIVGDNSVVLGTSAVRSQHHEAKLVWPEEHHEVKGIRIQVVESYNLKSKYHPKGDGIGYVLQFDDTSVYIAGDTDFIPEMRKIRADIVFLPVGGTYTMGAKEAAEIVLGMKPKVAVPIHWGSVVGTRDDAELFKEIIDNAGVTTVAIPRQNEEVTV